LGEIYLQREKSRIRLRRGHLSAPTVSALPSSAFPSMTVPSAAQNSTPMPTSSPRAEAAKPDHSVYIKSPLVGTFYAAPKPDADPFVKVGTRVSVDTIVCLIEAMKVYNDIKSGVSGTIAEILVENGQPVEYDQKLFRVEP
jgi:acetyl-CoA carboxylase biotin carboxyl carrier protein